MRLLVTGAAGQDGGYLCELAVSQGVEVHGTVRPQTAASGRPAHVPDQVRLHDLDVTDAGDTRALLFDLAPDAVVHLAGGTSVAASWSDPVSSMTTNGLATVGLIDSCVELARSRSDLGLRLVVASSSEIFGSAPSPQSESTSLQPLSPYGAAKAVAHRAIAVARSAGLHASSAILYPHESPRRPVDFVTRKITRSVAEISLGLREHLTLGNLDVERDWGFAGDYVHAMWLMLQQTEPDDYVIATGETHALRDLLDVAFAQVGITDWADLVRQDPAFFRPAEAALTVGDASKARERLDWKPQTTFDELVRMMVAADLASLSGDSARHP